MFTLPRVSDPNFSEREGTVSLHRNFGFQYRGLNLCSETATVFTAALQLTVERCFAVEGGFRRAPQLFSAAALRREASAGCRDLVSCYEEVAGGAEPSGTSSGGLGSVTARAAMPRAYGEDLAWRVAAQDTLSIAAARGQDRGRATVFRCRWSRMAVVLTATMS